MIQLPVFRWGQPYQSLDERVIVHHRTGEPIATIGQANGGLVLRDIKRANQARQMLRQMSVEDLMASCERAADLFAGGTLDLSDGQPQTAAEYVHAQSATTGLPEHMCRANMQKIQNVLSRMRTILDALTRGLDLEILARGYGAESRGVTVSYACQAPVLGAVLPSNSPGVHALWAPAIPLRVGLMLKPGSGEPWTPYRMVAAFRAAGIPSEVFGLYPGDHDVGQALISAGQRTMIFGGEETVRQYAGNPRVQVHGPGFSKILIGDDVVDAWPDYLDLMEESIVSNGGRSCINCSAIYASRHTKEIATALAERLGPVQVKPATDNDAKLAAFTIPSQAQAIWTSIDSMLREPGVYDATASFGPRLELLDRCAYLRPLIAQCDAPDRQIARQEFLFPFASIVECPQARMLSAIGPTLVATVLTRDKRWIDELTEATQIDRLNIGPIPTNQLNWLQPHEGNLVDFLYRSRAVQMSEF